MRIRLASEADAAAIRDLYAPFVETTTVSFELVPPPVDEMARRIAARQDTHPWLLAEDGGRILGYAYAGPFSARPAYLWSVEASVYIDKSAQRRGVGRALYAALLGLLGAQGYHRAFAGISLPNPASVGLHEAMGFSPVGVYRAVGWKFGRWHDVGWWQRTLPGVGPDDVPEPPRHAGELAPGVLEAVLHPG